MKRKLSFILALVFVLTLAFSALPGALADGVSDGTYTYGSNNLVVLKQANVAVIWVDSTLAGVSDTDLINFAKAHDASLNAPTISLYVFHDDADHSFNMGAFILDDGPQYNRTFTFYMNGTFTIAGGGISHYGTYHYEHDEGTLTVSKQVMGEVLSSYETSKVFEITVTFTPDGDPSLAGITTTPAVTTAPVDTSTTPDVTLSGNVYTIYLRHGQSVKFEGIPANTTYTVAESGLSGGWSNSNTTGELTGTVSKGDADTVIVKNTFTQQYGSLLVEKYVTNDEESSTLLSEPFTIKVIFTKDTTESFDDIKIDPAYAPLFVGSPVTDGNTRTYTLSLTHGDEVIFTDIPAGFTYTVEEQLTSQQIADGWSGSGNVKDQTITANQRSEVTISNTLEFIENPVGSLNVTKHVRGGEVLTDYEKNEVFDIVVTFVPTQVDLEHMGIVASANATYDVNGNVYTLHLKHGDSVLFTNIPAGTSYTVTENGLDSGWLVPDIQIVDYDNNSDAHIITATNEDTADVYNKYDPQEPEAAVLTVDKSVTSGSKDQHFDITVVFTGFGLSDIISSDEDVTGVLVEPPPFPDMFTDSISVIPSLPQTMTFTFPWSDNDGIITFSNIPYGTTYSVNESLSMPAYWSYVSGNTSGSFIKTVNVTIINNFTPPPPPPPEYGSLTVDKTVSGVNPSGTEKFDFTVKFKGSFGGITNNANLVNDNGVYRFTLSANDTPVTFSNIPVGTTYTVTEAISSDQTKAGWTQGTASGVEGTITTAGATAVIDNTLSGVAGESDDGSAVAGDSDVLPQTGGISPATLIGLLGLVLIAIGGTVFTVFFKKNDGKTK